MPSHVISYATVDAHDFADRLAAALSAGSPSLPAVLLADQGDDLAATIRDCASLIFVMTPASVAEESPRARDWQLALRYGKPILPLLLDASTVLPPRLQPRRTIDFTAFERGLTQLRTRLQQLDTPKGRLQTLKERLADVERGLKHEPSRQERTRDVIALIKQQIEQQQRVVDDPQRASKRGSIDIERQIERERHSGLLTAEHEEPITAEARSVPDDAALLRALDADGKLGLRDAPDDLLAQMVDRTGGDPQAMRGLVALLVADYQATLADLLDEMPSLPPATLSEWLHEEAISRLDPGARQLVQALAIYRRPVPASAVDYLLLPYLPGLKSEPLLKHLIGMGMVQSQGQLYRLTGFAAIDVLRQIPCGEPADRSAKGAPRFTQYALLHRAAEYFKQARLPEKSWKRLDDLAPQLAEFELRLADEDHETAASVLLTIGPTLNALGQQRRLIQLNERLQGKLDDYRLALLTTDQLAAAHQSLGEHEAALSYHQQSLALAREHNDRAGEGIGLGNLGQYWIQLGQPAKAMEQLKPALMIARETKDQYATQSRLLGLGLCAKEIGATEQALDYDEQALGIARRLGDKGSESVILGNLGLCYGDLGQSAKALDYLKQAQAIARSVGARGSEGTTLVNQAIILIDEQRYAEAEQLTQQSAQLAAEIASPRLASFSSRFLAMAKLLDGDRIAAQAAAEAALLHRSPEHTYNVLVLLGLALLADDREAAREHFTAAIGEADALLTHTPELFKALDAKGLALAGLAVIEGAEHMPQAIAAYGAARAINRDAGIVARVLRLLDLLATTDNAGLLSDVRIAAAGT
ncbi:MAG: tetratricopeptide repeat protein [Chloroflexi bacterium]|nr:tetratricopeptide repeat protein [Chloroflexota bacterium]